MKKRYIFATIGFTLGLIGALIGESQAPGTYQIYHGTQPGEIYTVTPTDPSTAADFVLAFGMIGLVIGYRSGLISDKKNSTGSAPAILWWWDLALVALVALSPVLYSLFSTRTFDFPLLVLVAVAVAFGPGIGLLTGCVGTVVGTLIFHADPIYWLKPNVVSGGGGWNLPIIITFGGLIGAITGWIASQPRPARLLTAGVVATILGSLQFFLWAATYGDTSLDWGLLVPRALFPVLLGLLIGLLLRRARTNGTTPRQEESVRPAEKAAWRR
jgi:hypothetical protein